MLSSYQVLMIDLCPSRVVLYPTIYRGREVTLYQLVVLMIDLNMMQLVMALQHHANDALVVVLFQSKLCCCRKTVFQHQLKNVPDVVCEFRKLGLLVASLIFFKFK